MKKLYLLDASGFLYRAYFAIQGMSSRQGESTNALYGFIRSFLKLQENCHPTHIAAIFDGPRSKEKRTSLYSDYKAHRKVTPSDLIQQIGEAKTFCDLMQIPTVTSEGLEADDTIASIALWARDKGLEVIICTGDKDLAQLVGNGITIMNPHKDYLHIDKEKVEEIYGISPEQIVDYLAIVGDTSDNIPGLSGFGPKTAVQLLKKYGTLEEILAHAKEIGGKKEETIEKEKEIALLSKKLVELATDAPFPHEEAFFTLGKQDTEKLREFYQQKNFQSLLKLLPATQVFEDKKTNYHLINTEEALHELVTTLRHHKELCVDTETTDLRPMYAKLVGIGLGVDDQDTYYIPCNGEIPKQRVLDIIRPLLESSSHAIYGHNIKYDLHVLENEGIHVKHLAFDTMIASYLLHAERRRHNLDDLALDYFNHTKIPISDLIGKGKAQISMSEVPLEKICTYCGEDVAYTIKLKKVLEKELIERKISHLLFEIELPLIPILVKMERAGIFCDADYLKGLSHEVQKEIKRLQEKIYEMAGEVFNLNSPKQLSEVLFIKLGIHPPKKGKTMPSTSAEVLEELSYNYPIAKEILDFRSVEKMRSTYIDTLPEEINPATGRIHCSFNQSVAATGRLSCQDPNLQNIPIRTPLGKQIRQAFRPQKEGNSFLSADYSQIELRLLAHITKDPGLIHAFLDNQDIHAYTAALVFNVAQNEVTEEMRRQAKAVNFGIVYGQQAYGLSQELGITVREADQFIKRYFERYPRVEAYIEEAIDSARKSGKAITLTGRERLIPEINSTNQMLRNAAERLAINTPLQGTAADLIKIAMLKIDHWLTRENLEAKMLLQIHDELLFEVPNHEIERLTKGVQEHMEHVMHLSVPLQVQIGVGKNWKEC